MLPIRAHSIKEFFDVYPCCVELESKKVTMQNTKFDENNFLKRVFMKKWIYHYYY